MQGPLSPGAAEDRLAAFGFTDVERTRAAIRELAFGLTRRSKLMQQLLPVILGWLSETPDPDLGLLQLRRLAEGPTRSTPLAVTFSDSTGAYTLSMKDAPTVTVSNVVNAVAGTTNNITIRRDPTNSAWDQVWVNVPTTGAPTLYADPSQDLTINGSGRPLVGSMPALTPMLTNASKPSMSPMP